MNQIVGNSIPIRIGAKVCLVSYVSIGEWETFGILQGNGDYKCALTYLLYSALYRADHQVTMRKVKRLMRWHRKSIGSLVDLICDISLPKLKGEKVDILIDVKESERNTKVIYRLLSKLHNWTPDKISSMSPAQIYVYLTGGSTGTGIERMSSAQYQSFRVSRGLSVRN